MGLNNDKKTVLDKIGAFSSLRDQGKLPRQSNSFTSVNNSSDPVPYLLDVLKTVAGTEALKQLVGGMFTEFIDKTEPKMKTALKSQFTQYNADDELPSNLKNNGVVVPVKNIDNSGKFKVNPDSSTGDLLYDKSKPNFDAAAYDAIRNEGTDTNFSVISLNYNKTTDTYKIKPLSTDSSTNTVGGWFGKFIDDTEIINKKELTTSVMDSIFGSVTAQEDKTIEQVASDLELNKLIEKIVAGEESTDLTPEEYDNIYNNAEELVNGVVNYDLSCGLIPASLSFDDMTSLIQEISGSTDPFQTSNAIEQTIQQSTNNNQEVADENQQTIKDGFFQRIIEIFTVQLIRALIAAPQIQALFAIFNAVTSTVKGVADNINTISENIDQYKVLVDC